MSTGRRLLPPSSLFFRLPLGNALNSASLIRLSSIFGPPDGSEDLVQSSLLEEHSDESGSGLRRPGIHLHSLELLAGELATAREFVAIGSSSEAMHRCRLCSISIQADAVMSIHQYMFSGKR